MGRPSIQTPELCASICERIALGESLRAICRDEGMPDQLTVHRWLSQDDDFVSKYVRARDMQADVFAEEIVEISDGDGDPQRDRLRVDSRKWFAAKLKPKKYGDATLLKHGDPDGKALSATVNVVIAGA